MDAKLIPGRVDFANILFSGPCNRFCPWCIGKQVPKRVNQNNLKDFPLRNIENFVDAVNRFKIRQVVFTGTNTDPQLYLHEVRLLEWLRERIQHDVTFSLHSNGVLALKKIDVVNAYDKACFSFPSFVPDTYEKLMGSRNVPPLERIIRRLKIPSKVSCIVNQYNFDEIEWFLKECKRIGVSRVVLRKLFGDGADRNPLSQTAAKTSYRNNPVYDIDGMEVTYWNFDESSSTSINLFPDGTLGRSYLLTETEQFRSEAA